MPDAPPIYNPTLHSAGLAALERVVNRALALDPATRRRLSGLADHVFLLHCTRPAIGIYLIPGEDEVRLCGAFDGEVHTTLRGSAGDFTRLATAADPANVLINSEMQLLGNSQALMDLQAILRDLDIDWEAPLAEVFGDVIGHQMGNVMRRGFRFGLQAMQGFKRQFGEYWIEESELVAPSWQVRQFLDEVDQLAMRTERLQARVAKFLAARSTTPPGNTPQG